MTKFMEALLVLVFYFTSASEGSCWRYGHSCWGGHGKRAGAPPIIIPDTATTSPMASMHGQNTQDRNLASGATQYQNEFIPIPGRALGYNYYAEVEGDDDDDIITVKRQQRGDKYQGGDFLSYLIHRPPSESRENIEFGVGERPTIHRAGQDDYKKKLILMGMRLKPEEDLMPGSVAVAEAEDPSSNEYSTSSILPGSSRRNNWSWYKERLLRHGK